MTVESEDLGVRVNKLLTEIDDLHRWNIKRLELIEDIVQITKESGDKDLLSVAEDLNIKRRKDEFRRYYLYHTHGELTQIYRNKGLDSAKRFLEGLVSNEEKKYEQDKKYHRQPHPYYNLAFIYYSLSRFIKKDELKKKYFDMALDYAKRAKELFHQFPIGEKISKTRFTLTKKKKEIYISLSHNLAALIHYSRGEIEPYLKEIDQAFECHPTPPEARFTRGVYHLNRGGYNQAIHDLQIAARTRTRGKEPMAEAYFHLSRAYDKKRHSKEYMDISNFENEAERERKKASLYRKAVSHLEIATKIDPKFALAYYKLGVLKLEDHCDKAEEHFQKAFGLGLKLTDDFKGLECGKNCNGCGQTKFKIYKERLIKQFKPVQPSE